MPCPKGAPRENWNETEEAAPLLAANTWLLEHKRPEQFGKRQPSPAKEERPAIAIHDSDVKIMNLTTEQAIIWFREQQELARLDALKAPEESES